MNPVTRSGSVCDLLAAAAVQRGFITLAQLRGCAVARCGPDAVDALPALLKDKGYLDEARITTLRQELQEGWARTQAESRSLQAAADPDAPDELLGRTLKGEFRLDRLLARGGMGAVYVGEQLSMRRRVAVKVLPPPTAGEGEGATALARFRREAEAAARLQHPNVVPVYCFAEEEGRYFIVMEFVAGETLGGRLRREGRIPVAEAVRIGGLVARALAAAHREGIVHRDVKPDNILLAADGGVKLGDFGLARDLTANERLSVTGAVLGTPLYMAPEQCQGDRSDRRTDLYALGAVLFHLVTGLPPYLGDSAAALMMGHVSAPVPSARAIAPEVPAALDDLLCRLLAKGRAQRPGSAGEVLAALEALSAGGEAAAPAAGSACVPDAPAGTCAAQSMPPAPPLDAEPVSVAARTSPPGAPVSPGAPPAPARPPAPVLSCATPAPVAQEPARAGAAPGRPWGLRPAPMLAVAGGVGLLLGGLLYLGSRPAESPGSGGAGLPARATLGVETGPVDGGSAVPAPALRPTPGPAAGPARAPMRNGDAAAAAASASAPSPRPDRAPASSASPTGAGTGAGPGVGTAPGSGSAASGPGATGSVPLRAPTDPALPAAAESAPAKAPPGPAAAPPVRSVEPAADDRSAANPGGTPPVQDPPLLGTNLSALWDGSTEIPLLDAFRTSRPWFSGSREAWQDDRPLDLDDRGWVRSLRSGQWANTLLFWGMGTRYPAGRYVVQYEGEGTIEYGGAAQREGSAPGRDVIRVIAPQKEGIRISLTAINRANPIRNIRVLLPGTTAPDEIFNPVFLDRIRNYRVLRFTNWTPLGEDATTAPARWSDRPRMDDARWSVKGAPVELMVALANRNGSDPWFSIPVTADDDYVRRFAQVVRQSLGAGRKAYFEFSTEVWNAAMPQGRYAVERGRALGLSADSSEAALRFYARRMREAFAIVESVLPAERRVRVLGGLAVFGGWAERLLAERSLRDHTDALAIAPYFYVTCFEDPGDRARIERMSLDELLRELETVGLPRARDAMREHADIARRHGVPLLAYSGGQFLLGLGAAQQSPALNTLFDAANRDPRMGVLYTRYLKDWQEAGGQLFVHAANCSACSAEDRFGALEYIDQLRAEAPKFDALQKFIRK